MQSVCIGCDAGQVDQQSNCGCASGKYLQEYDDSGTRKLRCVNCPKGYYTLANKTPVYYCLKCPLTGQTATNGVCSCGSLSSQSTFCVDTTDYSTTTSSYNPATSTSVTYDPVETGSGTTTGTVSSSDTFGYLLPEALYKCLKYQDSKQCNILANLCVYQMYKETEAPCLAFKNMQTSITSQQNDFYDSGWRLNLPWLYYAATGDAVIEKANRVQGKIEFQSSSTTVLSTLRFVMSKYSLEGDFLGYEDLTTQLQL